jgi:hypothetical protein
MITDNGIPKAVEEEVRSQLEPLFSEFYNGSRMYRAYYGYLKQLDERLHRGHEFLNIIKHAYLAQTFEKKEHLARTLTVLVALLYLVEIELVGSGYVDMAILLLTEKGIDFHLEPDYEHRFTRHVASPKDLDSPSLTLGVKLDFLSMNGLPFFAKCVDRDLRNKIAHADFEIDANGKFYKLTERGKRKLVDVNSKHICLIDYVSAIDKIFKEQMARVKPPPKQPVKNAILEKESR